MFRLKIYVAPIGCVKDVTITIGIGLTLVFALLRFYQTILAPVIQT